MLFCKLDLIQCFGAGGGEGSNSDLPEAIDLKKMGTVPAFVIYENINWLILVTALWTENEPSSNVLVLNIKEVLSSLGLKRLDEHLNSIAVVNERKMAGNGFRMKWTMTRVESPLCNF